MIIRGGLLESLRRTGSIRGEHPTCWGFQAAMVLLQTPKPENLKPFPKGPFGLGLGFRVLGCRV